MSRVVAGPDLEIRQDAAGRLFVSDYYVEGESPEDRTASTLALIRRRLHGTDTVTPIDARVGWRWGVAVLAGARSEGHYAAEPAAGVGVGGHSALASLRAGGNSGRRRLRRTIGSVE